MAGTFSVNSGAHPTLARMVMHDSLGREIVILAGTPIKTTDPYRIGLFRSLKRNGQSIFTET